MAFPYSYYPCSMWRWLRANGASRIALTQRLAAVVCKHLLEEEEIRPCFPFCDLMLKKRQGDQGTHRGQSLVCSTIVSVSGRILAEHLSHGDVMHATVSPSIRGAGEAIRPSPGCNTPPAVPAGTALPLVTAALRAAPDAICAEHLGTVSFYPPHDPLAVLQSCTGSTPRSPEQA